jgi:mRNA interferase MazF
MVPEAGDIAWFNLDPVKGSEQAGRRPGLILTSADYHLRSGRAIVCPITSKPSLWPFNVALPPGLKTQGLVLVDQIRTVERVDRMLRLIERAPADVLRAVHRNLAALLGFDISAPNIDN